MKTKVKVSQCHKFEVGMEGQHYLILFACFHGFMTLPIGRGMKKVELWNLDFFDLLQAFSLCVFSYVCHLHLGD